MRTPTTRPFQQLVTPLLGAVFALASGCGGAAEGGDKGARSQASGTTTNGGEVASQGGAGSSSPNSGETSGGASMVGTSGSPEDPSTPEPAPDPAPPLNEPSPLYSESGCDDFSIDTIPVASEDQDCDVRTPESCPAGSHIDFVPASPCAVCVEDTDDNRTCDWAEDCAWAFLTYIAFASGAKSCESDADCTVLMLDAGCGNPSTMALRASIDEELPFVAELYANDNCSLCDEQRRAGGDITDAGAVCMNGYCGLAE